MGLRDASAAAKLATLSAVGLLLGIGLCGVSLSRGSAQELGGGLAFFSLLLMAAAALGLLIALLMAIWNAIRRR